MASFDTEEGTFQQEEFFEGFGAAPEFDKFPGKIMAKAYAQKISSIREASDLKRVDKKPTLPIVITRDLLPTTLMIAPVQRRKSAKKRTRTLSLK
ncbi:hypothetical protein BDV12DRAFT_178110 [Aspergillus spectabilis]